MQDFNYKELSNISVYKNDYYTKISVYKPPKIQTITDKKNTNRDYKDEALKRAKRTVIDYGLNNKWNWFLTITFDNKKYDVNNFNYIKFKTLINHYKYYIDKSFKYIIIPEFGKKTNRLHFHALIYTEKTDNIKYMYYDFKKHRRVYRHEFFYNKYGASVLIPITNNTPFVTYYITKYITKDVTKVFKKYYICSIGLKKSEKLDNSKIDKYIDFIENFGIVPNYKNKYVKQWYIKNELI